MDGEGGGGSGSKDRSVPVELGLFDGASMSVPVYKHHTDLRAIVLWSAA